MASKDQLSLPYIPHAVGGFVVSQRRRDGYVNATAMCQAAGRKFNDYTRAIATQGFITELVTVTGIPATELIQSVSGGVPELQGSWVHPQVAINLAQWCSPRFAVQVSQWVWDWMRETPATPAVLPFHIRRYIANQRNVPAKHFSVLTEMILVLIAPLETQGYTLPEKMWPDISQGKMFARHMREAHGVDTDAVPTYPHEFEDGRYPVNAKAYPDQYLSVFRAHLIDAWMPKRMIDYFKEKDPKALPYIAKAFPALGYDPDDDW